MTIKTVPREHQPRATTITGTTIGICPTGSTVEIEVYNNDNIQFPCHAYASPNEARELAKRLLLAAEKLSYTPKSPSMYVTVTGKDCDRKEYSFCLTVNNVDQAKRIAELELDTDFSNITIEEDNADVKGTPVLSVWSRKRQCWIGRPGNIKAAMKRRF